MNRRFGLALALCSLFATRAHAGPVELFSDVSVEPGRPDVIALHYIFGGGGLFLSSDGGESFGLLCYAAVDSSVQRDVSTIHVSGSDAIFIGVFRGLWRGDADGCNWREVPELQGRWVAAIVADPLEPKRSYLVTSSSGMPNGVWVDSGDGDAWSELGSRDDLFLNTLHVVKAGKGRRFYETAARTISASDPESAEPDDQIQYRVRVSDDDAKTWREHEFAAIDQFGAPDPQASLQILAVSPLNPDVIVAVVTREAGLDDLLVSDQQGEPGSWRKLAELSVLRAAAFGPDGELYFGNYDQNAKSLWVTELDREPAQLSADWKVGCLRYDAAHARMYGCEDWSFGTVDLASGALATRLDMRSAEHFVECARADNSSTADVCENQLLGNYCGLGHYPEAPLCSGYPRPELGLGGADGGSGFGPLPPPAADQGSPASAAVGGGGSGARAAAPAKSSAGCSFAGYDARAAGPSLALLALGWFAVGRRVRRRRSQR